MYKDLIPHFFIIRNKPFTYHKKIKIKQQPFVDSGFEGFFCRYLNKVALTSQH
jgi:hypothetical protein